jgi:hypothetical protein
MNAAKISRVLILGTTALVAAGSVIYIQTRFDEADRKAAVGVVQLYKSRGGRTIPEVLDVHHPGREPMWSAVTESSCFQHVRVRASYGAKGSEPANDYDFTVDINGPSIHPGNPAAEAVLTELDAPPSAATSGDAGAP